MFQESVYVIFYLAYLSFMNFKGTNQVNFTCSENGTINCNASPQSEPIDFLNLFLNDDVLQMIMTEKNRQARRYRRNWANTDNLKMRKFVSIVMYTGLISYPKLSDYWSS